MRIAHPNDLKVSTSLTRVVSRKLAKFNSD